jgi:hypothetical protein
MSVLSDEQTSCTHGAMMGTSKLRTWDSKKVTTGET